MKSIIWSDHEMWTGKRSWRLICNNGDFSAIVEKAWITCVVQAEPGLAKPAEGPPTRVQVFFQDDDVDSDGPGGYPAGVRAAIDWQVKGAEREWADVPPNCQFLDIVIWDPAGAGNLDIEMKAKA